MRPETEAAQSFRGFEWNVPPGGAPSLHNLLSRRGWADEAAREKFLRPSLMDLTDPAEIPDLERGAMRLLQAVASKEKICVFSDYDVDGLTGGAQLVEVLRGLGGEVTPYVPHRFQEGYGLNTSAIASIAEAGVKVLVTVDCGISNYEEIESAKALGLECIVTDHHTLPQQLPNAYAVVHAKRIPGDHPTHILSGSGIAFKLAWGILKLADRTGNGAVRHLLDLACMGTLADIVPLRGENRILAAHGLRQLNSRARPGLRALMDIAGTKGTVSEWHVLFILGPRINAAGRLYDARKSMELLLEKDLSRAREIARELHAINAERREVGDDVQDKLEAQIISEELAGDPLLFLVGEGWHPGVVGIAAARIAERYRRPTVVLTVWEGMGRASVRSIPGVNVYDILAEANDIYETFGGHAAAAGFTVLPDRIPALREKLESVARERLDGKLPVSELNIDLECGIGDLSISLVNEIRQMAPFGEGNPEPIFLIRNLRMKAHRSLSSGKHAKFIFSDGTRDVEALGFGWGEDKHKIIAGDYFDIVIQMRPKVWNGYESVEVRLVDIRKS